ncbi:putative thiazole-containing bacteriocin maturation protein [Tumebacillus sp. ITR2]|uniref:Thiazole-containing bacteriocin maturation protein n=1 Tax=Tumebacillus amylolyticus TaxID=2801339 RepID=A0ABS1JEI5_9BACL|nr:putative thiazole-containing bacteriocin maturation protein [Tumebacillus amylolyticus]MBL0388399.1 putative thiazole-containing bacteriocin maturation protein [Tumebacillus amylolyticus]
MSTVHPSMCLKVAGGTFFLPDRNGGVYFRNHAGSFRMQGRDIQQWIEKLMPLFNGAHSLADLTEDLPEQHRNRIFELAEVLYENGIVRDVNRNLPHQLSDEVVQRYAAQIEYLDVRGHSGARRFQEFRQARVLVVGAGPFLVTMAGALLDAGLQEVHLLILDAEPTSRERLVELQEHARLTDSKSVLREVTLPLEEAVAAHDWILYVSGTGDVELVRALQSLCRQQGKALLPAMYVEQVGLVGPLVHPNLSSDWESAWRRIHRAAVCRDPKAHFPSPTAEALLANVVVFELMKTAAGVNEFVREQGFFLLNLETLEGNWHGFLPYTERGAVQEIAGLAEKLAQETRGAREEESRSWFYAFRHLTSNVSGILHTWEEGELQQLPMAQCRVQAVDLQSNGLADLLPSEVCLGLTHEEARREAGLAGLEAYVARGVSQEEFLGVGAGLTLAEAVGRGVQKCLEAELASRERETSMKKRSVDLLTIADERCLYELQALTIANGAPVIGCGPKIWGFPTLWVKTNGHSFWGIGLHETMAMRNALEKALQKTVMRSAEVEHNVTEDAKFYGAGDIDSVQLGSSVSDVSPGSQSSGSLMIPAREVGFSTDTVLSALQVLREHGKKVLAFDLAQEPFLQQVLAGVVGVALREEESP